MMTEKMREYNRFKVENAEKWADFIRNGGVLTPDKIKEMREDNEFLKKLGEEATREWLKQVEKSNKELEGD